jgi:hypothetical protein
VLKEIIADIDSGNALLTLPAFNSCYADGFVDRTFDRERQSLGLHRFRAARQKLSIIQPKRLGFGHLVWHRRIVPLIR